MPSTIGLGSARRTPRARHALLTLAAVAAASLGATRVGSAATADGESCPAPEPHAARRLHEVVGLLNEGDVGAVRGYTDSVWAVARGDARKADALAGDLLVLAWKSRGLSAGATCAGAASDGGGAVAGALVRNALTGEIDSVAVTVDAAAPHRIQKLAVRQGVRTPVAAEDTSSEALRLATVDRLARRLADAGAFSGVILVARDGRPVYQQAFGYADQLKHVPMRADARFNVGPLSETLTAVAVLQQVEARRLSLDDSLGAVLGDRVRGAARGARVAELLAHVGNVSPALDGRTDGGARTFMRGNDDYRVLGDALARVTGKSWGDYVQERVLNEAGMASTTMAAGTSDVIGYTPVSTTLGVVLRPEDALDDAPADAAGGMRTTAGDLVRFVEALRQNRLVGAESVVRMRTPQAALGAPRYGFGVIRWRGAALWGSAGDPAGVDADVEVYGESGYVAVILSNMSGANEPIRRRLAAVMPESRLSDARIANLE
jgi:CubicO group peptidase (beta-lactamase class C family)